MSPGMGGPPGAGNLRQQFGSGNAGGVPGQPVRNTPGYDDRLSGAAGRGGQSNYFLDPNLQGSGISMGNVGGNAGPGQQRGTNLGDQFMRNQGSVVDRSRSRGATSRGGGLRGQSVVSGGQYLPEGAEMGRLPQRDDRASLFDVVHGTSVSRAIVNARSK